MTISRVSLLISDSSHPMYPVLQQWAEENSNIYNISLVAQVDQLPRDGDILFLVSCSEFITKAIRDRFRYTLVLHASDLPRGKGWSPHVWSVINGENHITVSLINAEDTIDSGDIWRTANIQLDGTELYQEINQKLFTAEISLINWACQHIESAEPRRQHGEESYYPKRAPEDSRIEPSASIAEQFDLLRVCDERRFPAFFEFRGKRYRIRLEKMDEQ